jgi:hypothetical protein
LSAAAGDSLQRQLKSKAARAQLCSSFPLFRVLGESSGACSRAFLSALDSKQSGQAVRIDVDVAADPASVIFLTRTQQAVADGSWANEVDVR